MYVCMYVFCIPLLFCKGHRYKTRHFISLSGRLQQEVVGCLNQPLPLCIIDLLKNIVIFTHTHSKQNFNLEILPRVSCYNKME